MPKLDGTGPRGQGPLTGRGMGNCAGAGKGRGLGLGQGRGPRGQSGCILDSAEAIQEEINFLKGELQKLKK